MSETYENIEIFEDTEFNFKKSEYKAPHHEKDDEMLNIVENYKNEHQSYISKLYSNMVNIYHDFLYISKKCDMLISCNDLLKQHIFKIETDNKNNALSEECFNEDLFSS